MIKFRRMGQTIIPTFFSNSTESRKMTTEDLKEAGAALLKVKSKFLNLVAADADKEFGEMSQIGFGQDGDAETVGQDFQAVRGQYEDNQFVKKGDLLFEIDESNYQLAVDQAQVALDQAREDVQALEASVRAAEAVVAQSKAAVVSAGGEVDAAKAGIQLLYCTTIFSGCVLEYPSLTNISRVHSETSNFVQSQVEDPSLQGSLRSNA